MEDHSGPHCIAKIKIVIGRLSETDDWEIIRLNYWHNGFDTDLTQHVGSFINDILYTWDAEYKELLDKHAKSPDLSVFEVIADLYHESWKSWTDCGYEYDSQEWLENEKIRHVVGEDLEAFKEDHPQEWLDFYGLEIIPISEYKMEPET